MTKSILISALLTLCLYSCSSSEVSNTLEQNKPQTRYPMVLVHGIMGFDSVANISYFRGITEILRGEGYKVYTPEIAAVDSITNRANQLAERVDEILLKNNVEKVNIVAHSQGGLDTRYLISSLGYGDRVASLTTIAAPHRGATLANIIFEGDSKALYKLMAALSSVYNNSTQFDPEAARAALADLTTEFVQNTFNPQNPDDERVEYFSYGGSSWPVPTGIGDALNPTLVPYWGRIFAAEGKNDGFVSVKSARWGTYIKTLQADHFDQAGFYNLGSSVLFDHKVLFSSIAAMIKKRGY